MSKLKAKQRYALDMLKKKFNIFLSGEAGTGKSYVIEKFTEYLDSKGIKYVVAAPTGLAALNVNGSTLHRTFGLSTKIGEGKVSLKNVEEAEVIIIDEISMCRSDIFSYIARALIEFENPIEEYDIKRESKICRKKQIVVVGDFYQLPPFIGPSDKEILQEMKEYDKENETDTYKDILKIEHNLYAFQCKEWEMLNFKSIVLDEVVRQSDKDYIDNLNKVRIGDKSGLEFIKKESNPKKIKEAIYITGTNKTANDLNLNNLKKINEREYLYEADVEGEVGDSDKPVAEILKLKVGARVMSVVNIVDKDKGDADDNVVVVNGMLGTVTNLTTKEVSVLFDNGYEHVFEKYKWSVKGFKEVFVKEKDKDKEKDGKPTKKMVMAEIGTFSQIPLKLAWAITIHKSQGQSYEAVNLDPYSFADGQLYVALSRAKNIKKLHLTKPLKSDYLKTAEVVKEFYKSIELGVVPQEEYTGSTEVEVQEVPPQQTQVEYTCGTEQEKYSDSTGGVQEVNTLEDVAIALEEEEEGTDTISMDIPVDLVWKVEGLLKNEIQLKEFESNEAELNNLRNTVDTLNEKIARLELELEQAKSPVIHSTKPVVKESVAPVIDNKIDIEKILRLTKHGLDITLIARMCNTDIATVNKVLSKHK